MWQRLRGAREAELFGPRGRLPQRGEPDTTLRVAMAVLAGITAAGLALRLLIPRGLWLDEAISVHQANLSFHDLFENLQYGDRHPPLHHIVLWLTVRAFGDGELAVRLPSLIAGTLVIPAMYLLGRELYDRRTGLVAAIVRRRLTAADLVLAGGADVRLRGAVRAARAVDAGARDPRRAGWVNWAGTCSPPRRSCGRTTSACS